MADGQLAKVEGQAVAHTDGVNEPANLMSAIMQAAMRPEVDPEKMERMLAMYERMDERRAKIEFDNALAQMLPRLPEIGKRGTAENSGKKLYSYAKWEDINRAIKPILSEHGFALTFRTDVHEKGVLVTGVLSRGGHSRETSLLVPFESSGAKNDTQARGSSTSYGKRYTASALLNLVTSDEPDNDASGLSGDTLSDEQVQEILALVKHLGGERSVLLDWARMKHGVEAASVDGLPVEMFGTVKSQLNHWIKLREERNAG